MRQAGANRLLSRRAIAEAAFLVGLAGLLFATGYRVHENLVSHNIATGFGFLGQDTGWDVSTSLISHSPRDPYWRTFLIGLLNTLALSMVTIVASTTLGILLALIRQLQNRLLTWIIGGYVTILRNIPLIVQIFFWYGATQGLPNNRNAIHIPGGLFLSNRGLYFPSVSIGRSELVLAAVLMVLLALAIKWRQRPRGLVPVLTIGAIGAWSIAPAVLGLEPLTIDWPRQGGLNFTGGLSLQPELVAVISALIVYNTAFVVEIVRTGVQAVPLGQIQAAQNIGLRQSRIFWKIIMPQAVRVMALPLINQYANIVKATALAMVVGFPDLFGVSVVTINHTGQAVEVIVLLVLAYFIINATISLIGNSYERFERHRWTR